MGVRRAQVYAVAYDDQRNILVARKNRTGYFFRDPLGGGSIRWAGETILGGGNLCLPGGALQGVDPVEGALQRLKDEMNLTMEFRSAIFSPMPYYEQTALSEFYGVYIRVHSLVDIYNDVSNSLKQGCAAANAVRDKTFHGDYSALRKRFTHCPSVNELSDCRIVKASDVTDYFTQGNVQTGLFYSIVQNLISSLERPVNGYSMADKPTR